MKYVKVSAMYLDPFIAINILMLISSAVYFVVLINRANCKLSSSRFFGVLILFMGAIITAFSVKAVYGLDFLSPLMLFVPPIFYLYLFVKFHDKLSGRYWFHFIPGLVYLLYLPLTLIMNNISLSIFCTYYHWLVLISNGCYTVAAIRMYYRGKEMHSKRRLIPLLQPLVILNSVLLVILFVMTIWKPIYMYDYILLYYLSLIIGFSSNSFVTDLSSLLLSAKKYAKSTLSETAKSELMENILGQFEKEKYFTNRLAKLTDLAKKVNTSPNYVSQVINDDLQLTFLEMLTQYRIREAKIVLRDNPSLSIEQVAEKVGYNSKSAFYQSFKKIVGMTPLEFRGSQSNSYLQSAGSQA